MTPGGGGETEKFFNVTGRDRFPSSAGSRFIANISKSETYRESRT